MVAQKRKIKKSGNFKKIFFSVLLGIFLFGLIGFLIVSNLRIHKKRTELTNKIEEIKKEIQLLEERNEELKTGIIETTEDKVYWEAKVREQGYKKPGEEVVVVLPPSEEEKMIIPEKKPFLENLLDWIGF